MSDSVELYITKDLAEAGLLLAMEKRLVDIEKEGKICWFAFEDHSACKELVNDFWFNKCLVDARTYYQSLNILKNKIFSL